MKRATAAVTIVALLVAAAKLLPSYPKMIIAPQAKG